MATAKILVVAGGGNGIAGFTAGGGAGGVVYHATHTVAVGSYTITVGGAATDSVFSDGADTITALAGGGAGGGAGGSGGGSSSASGGSATQGNSGGGTGYGNNGGTGSPGNPGGGGGAGAVGGNSPGGNVGGGGGAGIADATIGGLLAMSSSGVGGYIAGGGGGSGASGGSAGGSGGGGTGGGAGDSRNGVANTGGGAGGTNGSGGSGVVIITYTTADFAHTGGDATGTSGSETWVKFTASGTLTLILTYVLDASVGSFALTGVAITFGIGMLVSAGAFVLTSIDTLLTKAKTLVMGTGVFTLTGQIMNGVFDLFAWDWDQKSSNTLNQDARGSADSISQDAKGSNTFNLDNR